MNSSDIERLRGRRAPIDMTPEVFRQAGHKLVDDIAALLGTMRDRPVNKHEQPSDIKALLPSTLPDRGSDPGALLEETSKLLFDHSLFNGHPRFYGYITAGPTPIGILADMLAASVNPNVGGWELSPAATEIEKQAIQWIGDLIDFPVGDGLFVSGGNMANFVCFLAARRAKAGMKVREKGLQSNESGRLLVYASSETHVWIQKAMDLFGHGTGSVREIPVRTDQRADIKGLHEMIENDRKSAGRPFLIVGTAGTVATGAVDPLRDMAAVAREYDLWFHVDGAYGALAAALPDASDDMKALSVADSVAVDPHKWLYSPLEAGAVLVRSPDVLSDTFDYRPPYYHFKSDQEVKTNFYERGPQNSRGFRALKVWLGLRQAGRKGVIEMIDDDCRLAREIYRVVDETDELEAVTQGLSITTFRYVPSRFAGGDPKHDEYLNKLNEATLTSMWDTGESFFSNAVIDDRFLLRACIVNFRTSLEDVQSIPEIVLRHGRAADERLRSA